MSLMKKKQKELSKADWLARQEAEKFLKSIKDMPYNNDKVGQVFIIQSPKTPLPR